MGIKKSDVYINKSLRKCFIQCKIWVRGYHVCMLYTRYMHMNTHKHIYTCAHTCVQAAHTLHAHEHTSTCYTCTHTCVCTRYMHMNTQVMYTCTHTCVHAACMLQCGHAYTHMHAHSIVHAHMLYTRNMHIKTHIRT